jgi:hypothetical protein
MRLPCGAGRGLRGTPGHRVRVHGPGHGHNAPVFGVGVGTISGLPEFAPAHPVRARCIQRPEFRSRLRPGNFACERTPCPRLRLRWQRAISEYLNVNEQHVAGIKRREIRPSLMITASRFVLLLCEALETAREQASCQLPSAPTTASPPVNWLARQVRPNSGLDHNDTVMAATCQEKDLPDDQGGALLTRHDE